MPTDHIASKPRVRVKPRLTWRPITSLRWRWHTNHYSDGRSGTRWFAFGVIPIWSLDDEPGFIRRMWRGYAALINRPESSADRVEGEAW